MNILVINGSPKGKYSITLQTVLYLEKCFPEHTFQIMHAGQRIKALQKDFFEVVKELEAADLILFSYPVYTFIAPSQLHRFIELMKESGAQLAGKFVTQITTSKHFYDVTAHRYIQDNCQDMGMKFVKGLSADMDDLLTEKGQKEANRFFRYVQWCMKKDSYEPLPKPLGPAAHVKVHVPEEAAKHSDTSEKTKPLDKAKKTVHGKQVVIVTDCRPQDDQLRNMIVHFQKVLPLQSRVVNIREYPFNGGCLGCFNFLRHTASLCPATKLLRCRRHENIPRFDLSDAGNDEGRPSIL